MQKTLIASAICALAVAAGAHAAAGPNGTNDITAGTKENPESPQSYCANHNCNFSVAWKGDDLILQSDYVSSAGAKRIVFKDYAKKLPVEAQQLKAKIREIRNKPDVTEEDIDSIKVKLKWTGRVYQGDEKDHDEGTFEFDFAPAGVNTENKTITVPATDSGSKAVFDIKQDNGKNAFVFNEKESEGAKTSIKDSLENKPAPAKPVDPAPAPAEPIPADDNKNKDESAIEPTVPSQPNIEAPKIEAPEAENPKADEAKPEEPKPEEPKADESKPEEPNPEEPKADEPKVKEPKADEPKVEEPKSEEPKVEKPKSEEPKVEEPKAEEPKVEKPKSEEQKVEESKAEEPKSEEPKAEETKAEDQVVENDTQIQSAVEPKSDKLIPSVSARDSRFVNAALLGSTLWQLEMNDVNKRLGDLHFAQGNEGLWLRSYGGKYSLDYHIKDRAFTSQNHFAAVQLGYDRTLDAHIRSGLAVSVVKGKAKLNQWAQNAQLVGVTGYTTYTPNEADYIDVVAKVAQLQQKIAGNRLALWGVAFSTEYGHKFTLSEHWFATPNAELTLGYLQGGDVNIEGHHYQQRSNTHWSARAGVNLGYAYNMGNIMLKASVQHEANNRLKLILDNGANDAYQHSIDLSGTQLRLGLGGTHDLGHNTYVYYNIEKSAKGKLHLHWRTDIGLRYSF